MKVILTLHFHTHVVYSKVIGVFDQSEIDSKVDYLLGLKEYRDFIYWTTASIDENGYVEKTTIHTKQTRKDTNLFNGKV